MSEQKTDLGPSPSESLAGWMSGLHLHRLTWLIVIAALLHLAGDTVYAISDLSTFLATGQSEAHRDTTLALVLAGIARSYGYSLVFFGSAATIEFLFRIWDELRLRRLDPGPKTPPTEH